MNTKVIISIFLLIVLVISFSSCHTPHPSSRVQNIIGLENYQSISSSHAAIFCVVKMKGGIEGSADYKDCKSVDPVILKEIAELMTNDQNYLFDRAKTNLFFPEFALIFKDQDHQFSMQINESAAQFRVYVDGRERILDYSPMKSQFNQLIKTLKK